jgi:hypothetical protein
MSIQMSTEAGCDWVDLLHTAKQIRQSVEPVAPSAGFRYHLRSDLETVMGVGRPEPAVHIVTRDRTLPAIIFGTCLGLAAVGLAMILLRGSSSRKPR